MPTARATDSVPGPRAALLEAAEELRLELDAVPYDECADAERAVEFVGGDGHRRRAELRGNRRAALPTTWAGVGVQGDAAIAANGGDFGDRLEHAGFVVGEHRGDEAGF